MVTELNMAFVAVTSDWWLDSGATVHVCNNREMFKIFNDLKEPEEVLMGNDAAAKVLGKGSVELNFTSGQKLTLVNVFYVPELRKNLVSASLLCKKGFKVVLESDNVIVSKNGVFVGKGYSSNGMFKLSINEINAVNYVDSSFLLWHARLGHLNYGYLNYMSEYKYINCKYDHDNKCEICVEAKMTKKPFHKVERSSELLQLVHSDICELNGQLTRGGKRYFITFIDDHSRYTYVYLMKTKDEAFDKFKEYKAEIENQKDKRIKVLRTDRGGEYFPESFNRFCEDNGIIHQRTAPYTPQQNGVAERKNRSLVDMINAMLMNAKLPLNLWGEALLTACHVYNKIPLKRLGGSPYELWNNGRKPNLNYFKVWGCIAYYKVFDPTVAS